MAEEGGLLGYGPRFPAIWRQRARLLVKVLRGTKPADIPIEQPTKFELVINANTAKALGLAIHPNLLATGDEVIVEGHAVDKTQIAVSGIVLICT